MFKNITLVFKLNWTDKRTVYSKILFYYVKIYVIYSVYVHSIYNLYNLLNICTRNKISVSYFRELVELTKAWRYQSGVFNQKPWFENGQTIEKPKEKEKNEYNGSPKHT